LKENIAIDPTKYFRRILKPVRWYSAVTGRKLTASFLCCTSGPRKKIKKEFGYLLVDCPFLIDYIYQAVMIMKKMGSPILAFIYMLFQQAMGFFAQ